MTESVVASLLTSLGALVAATVATLWSVGGRSTLALRRMKHELDIAAALPAGSARHSLEQLATERATLYVHRQSSPGLSPVSRSRLVKLTFGSFLLVLSLWVALTPPSAGDELVYAWLAAASVFGLTLGIWAGHAILLRRARRRERELEIALAAIQPRD